MLVISRLLMDNVKNYLQNDDLVSVSVGEFFEFWGDHFTWAAPSGMEINQDKEISSRFQFRIKIVLQMQKIERSGMWTNTKFFKPWRQSFENGDDAVNYWNFHLMTFCVSTRSNSVVSWWLNEAGRTSHNTRETLF